MILFLGIACAVISVALAVAMVMLARARAMLGGSTKTAGGATQSPGPDEIEGFVIDARTGEKLSFIRPRDLTRGR